MFSLADRYEAPGYGIEMTAMATGLAPALHSVDDGLPADSA